MINISGGGVRGLSCALYLLNLGYNVTIYETRQEIGNPVRSPGIIKSIPEEFMEQTAAKQNSEGWAFRREWFEKLLAKKVADKGGKIILKTEGPKDALDCTGGKSQAPGWPFRIASGPLSIGLPARTLLRAAFEPSFCPMLGPSQQARSLKFVRPRSVS